MTPPIRKPTFSNEAILKAIAEIRATGRIPTPYAVRRLLGGGDHRRIQEMVDSAMRDAEDAPPDQIAEHLGAMLEIANETITSIVQKTWATSARIVRREVNQLKERLDQLRMERKEEREGALQEAEEAARTIDDLRRQLAATERDFDAERKRMNSLNSAVSEMRGEANVLRQTSEKKDTEIRGLHIEIADLQSKVEQMDRQLRSK